MKLYKIYGAVALLTGAQLFSSCQKPLNINPVNQVDQKLAFNTAGDVKGALVGAYNRADLIYSYSGDIFIEPDLLGDDGDLVYTDTFIDYQELFSKKITTANGYVTGTWLANYVTINTVNNVLGALDKVDAGSKNRVEGEAKFLRALNYFDLVRLFGKAWNDGDPKTNLGVPIILVPTTSITNASKVARNTVNDVYSQVISDLNDAIKKLPAAGSNGFFADKACAQAELARVYLTQENFGMAAALADSVINSGVYFLTKTYAQEFPNPSPASRQPNSTEDIFSIQVSAQAGLTDLNTWYASATYAGRGNLTITPQHLAKYEAGDDRLNLFYNDGGSEYTGKFNNQYGNVVVIRLAEMYLIRAEANFLNSTTIGDTPLNDVNTIRARALLPPLVTLSIDQIRAERYKELCFEGQTLFDRKRYKATISGVPYNDNSLVFPIPRREIEVNPNLVQNPGYN